MSSGLLLVPLEEKAERGGGGQDGSFIQEWKRGILSSACLIVLFSLPPHPRLGESLLLFALGSPLFF